MELWQRLTDFSNLDVVAKALDEFCSKRVNQKHKKYAKVAERYYNGDHDILDSKIYYYNSDGQLVEDKSATNIKIPHPFFKELVDQKVNHMLSDGVKFETDDEQLKSRLNEYVDEDFQLFVQEVAEGASVKGVEFAYARTTNKDKLKFEVSDYLNTDTIVDDYRNEVGVVRTYDKQVDDITGTAETVTYAEVYTDDQVAYFVRPESKPSFMPDPSISPNPHEHVLAVSVDTGRLMERSYGRIPFYRLANNRTETSDLKPVKPLIDDYDRNASYLSNDLQDYGSPIFIVKNASGESIDKIRQNLRSRGALKVDTAPNDTRSQGVDVLTPEIKYEARKAKLDIDRESIYKFGMGFDSSQNDGSNLTNVVIQSRYSLLNMKCNSLEHRLNSMLNWCLQLIIEDIQRKYGESYDAQNVDIVLTRETLVNGNDKANQELSEAQRVQTLTNALVTASAWIGEDETLRECCEIWGLDYDEVKAQVDEESFASFNRQAEEVDDSDGSNTAD